MSDTPEQLVEAPEPVRFSAETISAEIVRRREAGVFTVANASNAELLLFDAMLSLRQLLAGLQATEEAVSAAFAGGGGIGSLLKLGRG